MKLPLEASIINDIKKDVRRTMTGHVYFQKENEDGKDDLSKVLTCISHSEPELGYVQGMGFMAAILLTFLDKEDTFQIMTQLINN